LEGLTQHIEHPQQLEPFEWRRRLRSESGNTQFQIKYYGALRKDGLIVATEFAPQKVVALDIVTGHEIVIFDGCQHGYHALFSDTFSEEQMRERPVDSFFRSEDGQEVFEIVLSAYYQVDFDEEFGDEADEAGRITLFNRDKVSFEQVKRNGFDVLQILLIEGNGRKYEIISEELA
jgi:hypothetical protein